MCISEGISKGIFAALRPSARLAHDLDAFLGCGHPSLPVGTLRPDPRQLEGQLALLRELERERSNQGAISGTL